MAASPPRKPTIIKYFRAGLYTRRSALFAPLRVIGIQVVVMNDALIDGQDMELLDTYQLQRRPGFSRFCSQQLNDGEIVNQFYSERSSTGNVFALFDSNQRLARFTSSAITTIWNKPSAAQAYTLMVGTQMYITAGVANGQKRFDTGNNTLHGLGLPAPAAAPTVAAPTGIDATFWQPNTTYSFNGTNNGSVLLDSNGNIQEARVNGGISGAVQPIWSITFNSGTNDGTQVWQNLGAPGQWESSSTFPDIQIGQCILDSNGNLQQKTSNGTSGASQPAWANVVGTTTLDGSITWRCMSSKGALSIFSGFTLMYVYSTQAPTVAGGYYHRSDGSPQTISTGPIFGSSSIPIQGAYTTNPDVCSIDIYSTLDGGSSFDYAGSVANNIAGGTWTFNFPVPITGLNNELTIPLGTTLLNDPPPGQTGTHSDSGDAIGYMVEWQGRAWAISNSPDGCKVKFTAGPDVDNGDPYACWPPANEFTFPGQGLALTPVTTQDQSLMLVWLNDAVKIIGGGPTTDSYYPDDLLENFGVSSANCIWKDGQTVYALTTSGQVFTMTQTDKNEISIFVGDLVQQFPAGASYLTVHRKGMDNGVFVADGASTVMRYGLNVQAWSPQYRPVGGIGALSSIETSTGVYTLCAARPTAGGYILGRDLTTWQDDGAMYSACFATVGSIVLSDPLEPLVPVYYVAGYFAAGGAVPTVSVMPNEISGAAGPGFTVINNPQDEPPLGATPSSSIMGKQWNLYDSMLQTSLLMHNIQVKISFPEENFPSTIFGIALKHDQTD